MYCGFNLRYDLIECKVSINMFYKQLNNWPKHFEKKCNTTFAFALDAIFSVIRLVFKMSFFIESYLHRFWDRLAKIITLEQLLSLLWFQNG